MRLFPFSAIVGQELLKKGLLVNAVDPSIGGVLIRGEKGKGNGNLLYIDEVNLLDDHVVDVLLDVAVSGRNVVMREGVTYQHPSRFILVGTMNPEEGELRPQLLDRFGLCVEISGEKEIPLRKQIVDR